MSCARNILEQNYSHRLEKPWEGDVRSLEQPVDEATSTDDRPSGWRKASACNPSGNCVEINRSAMDRVGVRDSKQPTESELGFGGDSWSVFLADIATR
jgi:hypothetical protein